MFGRISTFANIEQYNQSPIRLNNARNMLALIPISLIGTTIIMIIDALTNITGNNTGVLSGAFGIGFCLFALILVRLGHITWAAITLIAPFYLAIGSQMVLGDLQYQDLSLLALGTILAATINDQQGVIYSNIANALMLMFAALQLGNIGADFFLLVILFIFAGYLCYLIAGSVERVVGATLAERRSRLLDTSSSVARNVLARRDLEQLLNETVENIRDEFETVYHAQVFLIDDAKRNAVLRASTGEVGRQLMSIRHSLSVGSQSVIGQVTRTGDFVMAEDTSRDAVHRRNELLPNTRTELALPLRVADGIIGALDLQSLQANAFSEDDIEIFQALADQVALAIENARLVDNLQDQLRENRELLDREMYSRREIELLNSELVGRGWQNYIQAARPTLNQEINIDTGENKPIEDVSPEAQKVLDNGRFHLRREADKQILIMPIAVEKTTIAAMEFELPLGEVISEGVLASLSGLTESLGVVFENSRLFSQARSAASREQVVNDVASELLQYRDIGTIVNQAAPMFKQIINAQNTQIRLGAPDTNDSDVSNNGQSA